ncbi:MAG: aspartate-semialdehyde dehydrogenase [Legionellales bacterium]|nr:aspartate-semialdehyde dehydrogenase [Legionellales bacterium]OUX68237.1 MAG: hypothetical protein CBD38_00020 [bacterium TMED178]|tara:strand:- start:5512 stop:6615 length:1104 start_codon:yes stop_codon:yes gene_type:complete
MMRVGLIGWRGVVGQTLLNTMIQHNDFQNIQPVFFITSAGVFQIPEGCGHYECKDINDFDEIMKLPMIVCLKGSDFTKLLYPKLRQSGWQGYWLDSASFLRQSPDSCLVLDPVNQQQIKQHLHQGTKTFVGPNCTTALLLLAISGLIKEDLIDWVSTMTYQAISGAGAKASQHYLNQMTQLDVPKSDLLTQLNHAQQFVQNQSTPSIAFNIMPWIDGTAHDGMSKEEYKCQVEAKKILNQPIQIDGTCVRVGALRCHSQALTIQLKKHIPIHDLETVVSNAHPYVKYIPNHLELTQRYLHPASVSGKNQVYVGRMRYLNIKHNLLTLFTIGDQLIWGASEPIRRMILMISQYKHQPETDQALDLETV